MAYVEEFRSQIEKRDFPKMMQLWQEYCLGDQIDGQEIIDILLLLKASDFAKSFGPYVEAILPLALVIPDEAQKDQALTLIIDLQTSNSQALYELACDYVKSRFEKLPQFNEKMRLVGLRTKDNFQGALCSFALLNHFQKGNFVLHLAGWGVGKILDCSFLREQLTIEFENLGGSKRDITFKNAFKTIQVIPNEHFLALRYDAPETLELIAKENPIGLIHQILKDLGPKTAGDFKELLSGSVLDEEEYSRWWQNTRGKLKKEPLIEKPEHAKEPYKIRSEGIKHDHLVEKALKGKKNADEALSTLYSLTREYPELLKEPETKVQIISLVKDFLSDEKLSLKNRLKTYLFLDVVCNIPSSSELQSIVKDATHVEELVHALDIQLFKRRFLTAIKIARSDWAQHFAKLLVEIEPSPLKDFILKELCSNGHELLAEKALLDLADHPIRFPNALLWFFQRQLDGDAPLLSDQASKEKFTESLLVLLHQLEKRQNIGNIVAKDLVKKIMVLITDKRYHTVRVVLKDSSEQFVKEFLLLASKCHTFTDHDQKIIKSLVDVVHPSISKQEVVEDTSHSIFWATLEGYNRVKSYIEKLSTTEVVENAKEIEAARALGDLRENSEYKFALEKRARIQSEIKTLSVQFNAARIITKDDIDISQVGIGTKVTLKDAKGKKSIYTILGPWDTDAEKLILSPQSKFVEAMLGKKVSESFSFKDDSFTIASITNYLE